MDVSKLTVEDVAEIKDQDKLLGIAKNSELDIRIRIKAFDNIEDKGIFRDYVYDEDSFLRMCAVKYVDDEVLLDLILNDSNDFVRHEAGGHFVDCCDSEKYEDVLLEFALENPKYNVSPLTETDTLARFACMRINDTSKLLEVVKESKSKYVYRYAMRTVSEDALTELLYSGELDADRAMIVALELKDEKKLMDLLYGGKLRYKNRIMVAMELKDDEKLKKLLVAPIGPKSRYIPNDGNQPYDINGVYMVQDLFPGDEIYTEIVFTYPNEEIAIMALNLIGYKSNLKKIMKNHKSPKMRELAAKRLDAKQLLI